MDDEEIEHEGMAQFIPWDTYGMKVVGTARNGAEGLEKIAKYKPDLAIVDIKMPVMNGIEMIRKAKKQYPDMTFVVLSGYGDYEFTSQAMELGVRHYILKPCDEAKMIPVLNKAIAEMEEPRAQNARSEKVEAEARLLKPYAREQLFRDLLQGCALPQGSSTRQLLEELGGEERSILLLDFRLKCGFDSLERYVVGNMLGDLLPDSTLLMTTGIDRDVLVLADAAAEPSLESAVQVLKRVQAVRDGKYTLSRQPHRHTGRAFYPVPAGAGAFAAEPGRKRDGPAAPRPERRFAGNSERNFRHPRPAAGGQLREAAAGAVPRLCPDGGQKLPSPAADAAV